MILLALGLAAALSADTLGSTPAPPRAGVARDVSIIVHRQPAVPLVTLRVSLLADDPAGYAGAGHMMQHMLLPTLQQQAARVGGRVQASRNSDALVYTITGPASELPYLASVARGALRPRRLESAELLHARYELDEERRAEWEQAEAHARSVLRASLFPQDLPAAGTAASAERLDVGTMLAAWTQMYRPERVSVVAVGDVNAAEVEEAFRDMAPLLGKAVGEGSLDEFAADTALVEPIAVAQATRGWLGLGYRLRNADPAAVSVAARVLQNSLQARFPRAQVAVDHWWTHHGQAVAVVIAATSGTRPATLAAPVAATLASLEGDVDPDRVSAEATRLRHEVLFSSRTPERMAEILGQFMDRTGDPNAAQQYYARLDRVNARDVRRVFAAMLASPPEQIDIPAQVLKTK